MIKIHADTMTISKLPQFSDDEPSIWQASVRAMFCRSIDSGDEGVHGVIWTPGEVTASGRSYEDALVALANTVAAMGAVA